MNIDEGKKNILRKKSSIKKIQEMRIININDVQPRKYMSNYIKTAKYNWITFLPLSIFYQFNNYFNCFFLFTAVLTSITLISPIEPSTAIAPFVFVLVVSLIRELLEDIKRANYDKMANNSVTLLYDNNEKKFLENKWKDLLVGKIIKVKKNEMIPADILVIKSSDDNGLCYLQTTNLDGESALKARQAINSYQKYITDEQSLSGIIDTIEVDLPNNHIYRVEGYIYLKKENNRQGFFSIDNILLRGGRLKNVDYVYGVVIYTGRDTKIMQNIKEGLPKQSTIEKQLNTIIIYILIFVIFLCVVCTVFGAYFRNDLLPDYSKGFRKGEYIFYYDYSSSSGSSNDVLEIVRIFAGLFIIFNTLIPISLMITSDVIKTFQVGILEYDQELKQDPDDKLKIISMKLHEDLGNVRYIFSDKTGTLTKNEMSFRACSVFGKPFGETDEEQDRHNDERNNNNINLNNFNPNANTGMSKKSIFSSTFNLDILRNAIKEGGILNIKDIKKSPIQTLGEACREFFFNISLNHNVLVELEDETEGEEINNNNNNIKKESNDANNKLDEKNENKNDKENIQYQGSNPDEIVLVTASAELGIKFLSKDKDTLIVDYFGEIKRFTIIQKFEFSSERKRSSIIIKDENGDIKIYVKGSDEKILAQNNINEFSKNFLLKETKEHLDSFARIGLRTLCFGYKVIQPEEYNEWELEFNKIKQECIIDKSKNSDLEKWISKMEENLILLGATALEDKLQDNVKTDLQEFLEAGISVWMITGDKLDTAESIGYSCRLFNDDTEVFKIKSSEKKVTRECLKDIKSQIDLMKGDCDDLNNMNKEIRDHHSSTTIPQSQKILENNNTNKILRKADELPFKTETQKVENNKNIITNNNYDKHFHEKIKDNLRDYITNNNNIDTKTANSNLDLNKFLTNNISNNYKNANHSDLPAYLNYQYDNNLQKLNELKNVDINTNVEQFEVAKKGNHDDLTRINTGKFNNMPTGRFLESNRELNGCLPNNFNYEFDNTVKIQNHNSLTPLDSNIFHNFKENNNKLKNNSNRKYEDILHINEAEIQANNQLDVNPINGGQNIMTVQQINPHLFSSGVKNDKPELLKISNFDTPNFNNHYNLENNPNTNKTNPVSGFSLKQESSNKKSQSQEKKKVEFIEQTYINDPDQNILFPNLRSGEIKRKLETNKNLENIRLKMNLNDNLHNDKNLEKELDSDNENDSDDKNSNGLLSKNMEKSFNSIISSNKGYEIHQKNNLKSHLKNSNMNDKSANSKKRNTLQHPLNSNSKHKFDLRRKSFTPNVSTVERNNILNLLSNKLLEHTPNPQLNDTDKDIDISDRSIIEYLANNHFFDDSQGLIYNPTFLGNYMNKNLNDTNNKILRQGTEEKYYIKSSENNNKSNSRNIIGKKISINDLKNILKQNKSNSKIKFKNIHPDSNNQDNTPDGALGSNLEDKYQKNSMNQSSLDSKINHKDIKHIISNFNNGNKQVHFENEDNISFQDKSQENNTPIEGEGSYNNDKHINKADRTNHVKDKDAQYFDVRNPKFFNSTKAKINLNKYEIPNENKGQPSDDIPAYGCKNNNDYNQYKVDTNERQFKESDEKRFITNDDKNNNNKKYEKVLTSPNKRYRQSEIKDIKTLKISMEKNKMIKLNEAIEQLDNIVKENEKNKKKTLINLIDFQNKDTDTDNNVNLHFSVMNIGILIEGDSISHCLEDDLKEMFWNLIKNSKSVVCCRCSPKQKAEVVGFVKKMSKKVTLAIGDGGNDIPMIKIANVGIGIFGKEGYQAAFNADYAISQFKYLKKLIFVHGRNSLLRNSYFYYFFFFKNVFFTITQLWFCIFSGFSGGNFYDSWYYLGFNSFITTFPVGAKTLVEEDIDLNQVYINQKEKKINLIPDMYKEYRNSAPFNILKFSFVFVTSIIFSIVSYFVPYYIFYHNFQDSSGRLFEFWDHGLSSYINILIVHFFILFEDTYYYNWLNVLFYAIQIGIIFMFIFIHDALNSGELSGITNDILWNFNFWATTLLAAAITCMLFLIVRRFDFLFSDSLIYSIMQKRYESNFTQKLYKKKLEELKKFHRSIAKFKKIYKMKNNQLDNLSDKRFKDIVEAYKRNHQSEKKISNKAEINKENIQNNHNHHIQNIKPKTQYFDDLDLYVEKRNKGDKKLQFVNDENFRNINVNKFETTKKPDFGISKKN